MSREIKFRAWDRLNKCMVLWNTIKRIFVTNDTHEIGLSDGNNVIYFDIMQFTGCHDKNNTEIYEGDIFVDEDNEMVGKVVFRNGSYGTAWFGIPGGLMEYGYDEEVGGYKEIEFEEFSAVYTNEMEIKGNIYKNPELMKKVNM